MCIRDSISGIFSATEAAAVAVVYGFLVGMFIYKEITLKDLPGIFVKSAQTAAGIMIITGCAYIFAWFITAKQLPQLLIQVMYSVLDSDEIGMSYSGDCEEKGFHLMGFLDLGTRHIMTTQKTINSIEDLKNLKTVSYTHLDVYKRQDYGVLYQ